MAEEAKEWFGHFQKAAAEIKELRARLAAVEALCDDGLRRGLSPDYVLATLRQVRAAAAPADTSWEGDRPAAVVRDPRGPDLGRPRL